VLSVAACAPLLRIENLYRNVTLFRKCIWKCDALAGTSCATPTFAGIVALVNDARLAAGKPR
jgi:subtilase family serine protease